jgi:adenylosuccinate synthase
MPVTVVVGGQYGSEGKGKVAQILASEMSATAAVRVGGPNSGHTAITTNGAPLVFQHLPTAALCPSVLCIIAPGSYLDPQRLLSEIHMARLPPERVLIDPSAVVIEPVHRDQESASGLRERIGSTLSGTGAAVQRRIERLDTLRFAVDVGALRSYVRNTVPVLRELLDRGARIILEGTQGFGLSLLHSPTYPYVTSRDTTAASFVAEAGLSPLDVDDVVLVLRAFPIRVAGASGPLLNEVDWPTVTRESGSPTEIVEYTSVTRAVRRVARFSPDIVRAAIAVNNPTRIALNHLDYIDHEAATLLRPTERVGTFLRHVAATIGRAIDYFGFGPGVLMSARHSHVRQTA